MVRIVLVWLILLASPGHAAAMDWNGLFLAGDDSIEAFDNSQRDLVAALALRGLDEATRYTASRRVAKRNPDVMLLTKRSLDALEASQIAGSDEGCLVHLTSHGTENGGFYLSTDGGIILDPDYMGKLLDQLCSTSRRTVVLISACYSGQFLTDALKRPNRIILTAASAHRPSFGCSSEDTYTYWDGCLISEVPHAKTWGRLYDKVSACIRQKEAAIGAEPSQPQAWFGPGARDWRLMQ